jgi:ribosome maturation factor RimP
LKAPYLGFFILWRLVNAGKLMFMEEPAALFFWAKYGEALMRQAPEHLVNLIEPIVEGLGYECVGIEYHAHRQHSLLRIYIDKDGGILLDDCSKVSHQLSGVLDVEDPISGNYQLEISSPGEDRPFFKLSQFERYVGSTVNLNLFAAVDKRKKICGEILAVEGDVVVLREDEQIFRVPFPAMSKARLVPGHLLIKGDRHGK